MIAVDAQRLAEQRSDALGFGAEHHAAFVTREVKRLFTKPIAAQMKRAVAFVVERERPHALAPVESVPSPVNESLQQYFCIRRSGEPYLLGLELAADLDVVIELAVVGQPAAAPLHGLVR